MFPRVVLLLSLLALVELNRCAVRHQNKLHKRIQVYHGQNHIKAITNESLSFELQLRRLNGNTVKPAAAKTPAHRSRRMRSQPEGADIGIRERVQKPRLRRHRHAHGTHRLEQIQQGQDRRSNLLPVFYRAGSGVRSWVRACYLAEGLPIEKLDPRLCTHLLAFFGGLTESGELTVNTADRRKLASLVRMRNQNNPSLRVLLTTGGSHDLFALISSNRTTRIKFAASAVKLLNNLQLDGLDLDWEFPAYLRPVRERADFVRLLNVLKTQLKRMSAPRLLTVAVGAPPLIVLTSYDVPGVAAACDFVSIMAYDYHVYSSLLPATGHNTPVFASVKDSSFLSHLNANYSIHLWLKLGLPREKLLLGIATYGRSWTLRDPGDHGLYAPASGVFGGGYTSVADVCGVLKGNGTRVWDPFALVPYAYSGVEWISYDDEQSVAAKAMLVRSLDVAGAMTFILDSDDWGNDCGRGEFPLHKVVRDILPSL